MIRAWLFFLKKLKKKYLVLIHSKKGHKEAYLASTEGQCVYHFEASA
jgi:hypothetical protein